jgi:hypothetical protein
MATKESLLEKAKNLGLKFQNKPKKTEIEEAIAEVEAQSQDESLPQQTKEALGESEPSPETDAPDEEQKSTVPDNFNAQVVNHRPDVSEYINANTDNNEELSPKKQLKLEKELSDPKNGINARVITSTGNYIKVKLFHDNKPFAIYKSRMGYNKGEIQEFIKEQRDAQGF